MIATDWVADLGYDNEYVDYLIGSGPMLLGHGHPEVMEAVLEQLPKDRRFLQHTLGLNWPEVICDAVPCAEQLRYVSTGEADMADLPCTRLHGTRKIVKFEGAITACPPKHR